MKFIKGQRLRLGISRRFTKEDIFALFAGAGFKLEAVLTDENKDNALVLCKSYSWERQ